MSFGLVEALTVLIERRLVEEEFNGVVVAHILGLQKRLSLFPFDLTTHFNTFNFKLFQDIQVKNGTHRD